MHAVVTTVKIADRDKAEGFLKEQVIPRVSEAPGFVSGSWVNLGDRGTSIALYESEEAAKQAVDQVASPPAEAVTIESMEVGEVVAQA